MGIAKKVADDLSGLVAAILPPPADFPIPHRGAEGNDGPSPDAQCDSGGLGLMLLGNK